MTDKPVAKALSGALIIALPIVDVANRLPCIVATLRFGQPQRWLTTAGF